MRHKDNAFLDLNVLRILRLQYQKFEVLKKQSYQFRNFWNEINNAYTNVNVQLNS